MTRVNMFVDMDTELVKESSKKAEAEMAQESSSKSAREELEHEIAKKQKMEDDKEKEYLKQCSEIAQDYEVAIYVIPLATKPAPIVNFQIYRKGRNGYYEIMRAGGSSKIYLLFSQLIKSFDKEDLETLWKLVKAKIGITRPEEGYERVIWGDLKTMFEDMRVYMLVEKRYPLTPATINDMLNKKLQADYWNEDMVEKEVSTADPVTTAGEVVTTTSVEVSVATTTTTVITKVDLTLAQALAELRSAKPKVVVQEPVQSTTTTV
ncbi:hypothetical protein Tco_1117388 [Tanacetum coccineum]